MSTPVLYFVVDVMVLNGRDLKGERLEVRRDLLEQKIILRLVDPVHRLA